MRDEPREVAVVRQQEQPLRLHVEAADRLDAAPQPARQSCRTVSRPSGSDTVVTKPFGLFRRM